MPPQHTDPYDLTSLIDLHIHTAPDVIPRRLDDLQAARDACAAGMRAILIKSHVTSTADRAAVAESAIDGIRVLGGLALNEPVGGLNPAAVEAALRLGAKAIWMPTHDAAHSRQVKGGSGGVAKHPVRIRAGGAGGSDGVAQHPVRIRAGGPGGSGGVAQHPVRIRAGGPGGSGGVAQHLVRIRAGGPGVSSGVAVLDQDGELAPAVGPILELIRDAGAILCTGHISLPEIIALVRLARQMGLPKILVTHPESRVSKMPGHIQRDLAGEDVFYERCFLPVLDGQAGLNEVVANIRAVGSASTVLSTDLGQASNPAPVDGLRAYLSLLEAKGLSKQDIARMAGETPAYLLGL